MSDSIHAALVAAQAQLTNPSKDGKANYGTYATLAGVLDHVRPILAGHGLYVAQYVTNDDTHVRVTTSIGHTSGESIDCGDVTWPMPDKVQVFGGLITYLRRYAITAALGLSGADDDDDGAQANTVTRSTASGSTINGGPAARAKATSKQVGLIWRLMKAHNFTEVTLNDAINGRYGWELPQAGLEQLTMPQASDVIEYLNGLPKDKPIIRTTHVDPADPWTNGQFPPDPEAGA